MSRCQKAVKDTARSNSRRTSPKYARDAQDVNGQIRLSMFTLTKMLQEKAVEKHVESYRARRNHLIFLNQTGTLDEPQFHTLCEEVVETAKQLSNELTEKLDIEIEKSREVNA